MSVKKEREYQESKFAVNDAVFARNFGAGPEWVQGVITKVLGSRNYLVKIDAVGNAIVKRHLSQLFDAYLIVLDMMRKLLKIMIKGRTMLRVVKCLLR